MWQNGQKLKMQGNLLRMRFQVWSKTVPYFEIRRKLMFYRLLFLTITGLTDFKAISKIGSCLLWVMSTEISVDIAVDTQSIVGRHSVDSRSTLGWYLVDTGSILDWHSVDIAVDSQSTLGWDTVDSRSRWVSANIAFRSPTLVAIHVILTVMSTDISVDITHSKQDP